MLWFETYCTDHNDIFHTSRQCNCRDMRKISLYLVKHILNYNTPNFYPIPNLIEMPLMGWAPGERTLLRPSGRNYNIRINIYYLLVCNVFRFLVVVYFNQLKCCIRGNFAYGLSQLETTLQPNAISKWLAIPTMIPDVYNNVISHSYVSIKSIKANRFVDKRFIIYDWVYMADKSLLSWGCEFSSSTPRAWPAILDICWLLLSLKYLLVQMKPRSINVSLAAAMVAPLI